MTGPLATYLVCGDCTPAGQTPWIRHRQLDDYLGRCATCGQTDGNLRQVDVLNARLLAGWVTATGRQVRTAR